MNKKRMENISNMIILLKHNLSVITKCELDYLCSEISCTDKIHYLHLSFYNNINGLLTILVIFFNNKNDDFAVLMPKENITTNELVDILKNCDISTNLLELKNKKDYEKFLNIGELTIKIL